MSIDHFEMDSENGISSLRPRACADHSMCTLIDGDYIQESPTSRILGITAMTRPGLFNRLECRWVERSTSNESRNHGGKYYRDV